MKTKGLGNFKIGDKVKLLSTISNCDSFETYSRGHEFTVYSFSRRGINLVDNNGNKMTECLSIHDQLEKIQ